MEVDTGNLKIDFERIESDVKDLTYDVIINDYNAEESELELLTALAHTTASREELRRRIESDKKLIDAAVIIDPTTGVITNRAYQYADNLFTQAQLEIDGVNASITATVESVSLLEDEVNVLNSELALLPGEITAIATSIVSESLAALEPAYSLTFR